MTTLYRRRCVVLAGIVPATNDFSLIQPNGLRIDGLKCSFKIERDDKPQPNTLELTITNLSENSRAKLAPKGWRIIVQAGYDDGVAQIFSGDVRECRSRKESTEWITKVLAGDGERAFAHARVSASHKPGTSITDVVKATAQALLKDPGNAFAKAQTLVGNFSSGYAQHARASTELTRLLEPRGWGWSIQDGRIELLKDDGYLEGQGPKISPNTGLIGTPEITSPTEKGGKPMIKIRSLLLPTVRPGQLFALESRPATGSFKAKKVTHTGDTSGGDWFTDIEAETK